ncbi:MAG: helix-turn-helix domain-containing protein [Chloroflexota bacterium]
MTILDSHFRRMKEKINELRIRADLTQEQVAVALGCSRSKITNVENQEHHAMFSIEEAYRFAVLVGTHPHKFLSISSEDIFSIAAEYTDPNIVFSTRMSMSMPKKYRTALHYNGTRPTLMLSPSGKYVAADIHWASSSVEQTARKIVIWNTESGKISHEVPCGKMLAFPSDEVLFVRGYDSHDVNQVILAYELREKDWVEHELAQFPFIPNPPDAFEYNRWDFWHFAVSEDLQWMAIHFDLYAKLQIWEIDKASFTARPKYGFHVTYDARGTVTSIRQPNGFVAFVDDIPDYDEKTADLFPPWPEVFRYNQYNELMIGSTEKPFFVKHGSHQTERYTDELAYRGTHSADNPTEWKYVEGVRISYQLGRPGRNEITVCVTVPEDYEGYELTDNYNDGLAWFVKYHYEAMRRIPGNRIGKISLVSPAMIPALVGRSRGPDGYDWILMDLVSGRIIPLQANGAVSLQATLSDDGTKIAFWARRPASVKYVDDLVVLSLDQDEFEMGVSNDLLDQLHLRFESELRRVRNRK